MDLRSPLARDQFGNAGFFALLSEHLTGDIGSAKGTGGGSFVQSSNDLLLTPAAHGSLAAERRESLLDLLDRTAWLRGDPARDTSPRSRPPREVRGQTAGSDVVSA